MLSVAHKVMVVCDFACQPLTRLLSVTHQSRLSPFGRVVVLVPMLSSLFRFSCSHALWTRYYIVSLFCRFLLIPLLLGLFTKSTRGSVRRVVLVLSVPLFCSLLCHGISLLVECIFFISASLAGLITILLAQGFLASFFSFVVLLVVGGPHSHVR